MLRLAYPGLDGAPRVVPLGYLWDRSSLRIWTIPISAKVDALKADARVAITIDIIGPPPACCLPRTSRTRVDGVPDGYPEASHRTMPREARDGFDSEVRTPYEQMVAFSITPHWAKLLEFETTAPSAVEQLVRQRNP